MNDLKSVRVAKKRREWVNDEFKKRVEGTHMSNKKKTKLLKKLHKLARKKFK